MFTVIDMERARDGLSIKELAYKANMKYETLLAKLNGKSEFNRSEMLRIQKAFSKKVSLEELFSSNQNQAS